MIYKPGVFAPKQKTWDRTALLVLNNQVPDCGDMCSQTKLPFTQVTTKANPTNIVLISSTWSSKSNQACIAWLIC